MAEVSCSPFELVHSMNKCEKKLFSEINEILILFNPSIIIAEVSFYNEGIVPYQNEKSSERRPICQTCCTTVKKRNVLKF